MYTNGKSTPWEIYTKIYMYVYTALQSKMIMHDIISNLKIIYDINS